MKVWTTSERERLGQLQALFVELKCGFNEASKISAESQVLDVNNIQGTKDRIIQGGQRIRDINARNTEILSEAHSLVQFDADCSDEYIAAGNKIWKQMNNYIENRFGILLT